MRKRRLFKTILLWLIVVSVILSVDNIQAEEKENIIDSNITINIDDGTNFSISAEIDVTKISLEASGTTYTGEYIENNVVGTETMGAIKYALRSVLLDQIKDTFENADVTPETELPSYENEKFYDSFKVYLNTNYFGINESINSHELINGVLDMGAQVNYSFSLKAEGGWNNTYDVKLGENIDYTRFTGGNIVSAKTIRWSVSNWNGETPEKIINLDLEKENPTTDFDRDRISISFTLDTKEKQNKFKADIIGEVIDIREYSFLPNFITNLDYVSSDGIRLFINNNMIEWNDTVYDKTIKQIKEKIKTTIESTVFNQTLNLDFNWDSFSTIKCEKCYDIDDMDTHPPVNATFSDENVNINIYGISSRALYGLVKSGGIANISKEDINFASNLTNIGYPYNITILLPENILFNYKNTYTWNDTIEFKGKMESEESPDYYKEEKDATIEIDIKNSDLNLLGFFTGNPELNLGIDIVETKNINVTTVPDEFTIPDKIDIKYLNSDAIRLCIIEEAFSENEVKKFLENKRKSFENRIPQIISGLKINGKINREKFDESINKEVNFSDVNKEPPVTPEIYANTIHHVRYNYSILPPSFDIPIQKYNFKGLENESITYRMFFPKGLSVDIINDTLGKAKIKKTKDNREYIEVSFSSEEADIISTVSCKLTPSWLFMIGLFMPCIITFIVVLILIIAIFFIRKKRKYKKPAPAHQEGGEDYGGYEEENYYIPPPPGSK